jgi:aryl-alcohol dehydrogenase-like predicted oxidoreductase
MEHRRLGKSGLKVSTMCLGAMTFGESTTFMKGVTSPDDEARRVLDRSLEAGIDFVDTANVYSEGRSEELLGQWLGAKRKDVILATKCRFPVGAGKPKPMEMGLSRRHIIQACEDSLKRLRTDWIDLYQTHMQDGATEIDETLRALDDLIQAGKIRYIGCSNYTGYRLTESLWAADKRNLTRYESVQLQWNLVERAAERELIPASRAFGLGVLVWSPLSRGFLSGKYQKDQAPPPGSRLSEWKDSYKLVNTEQNWKVLDVVKEVAREVESTPARVSLAWLLGKPECTSVIIGARDVKQLDDNLAAQSVKLSPAQLEKLDKASEPAWGYPYGFIGTRERW